MKTLLAALAASAALLVLPVRAAQPTAESVEQLLAATDVQKMLDTVLASVDQTMRQAFREATKNQPVTPAQQRVFDEAGKEMAGVLREELAWDRIRPLYVEIYQSSFTQEEIDGLLAFYKSPTGAAFVRKMPIVMQKSMAAMQARMGPMMEKMQAATERAVARAKAAK